MLFNRPNISFKVISNPWDKPRVLEKFLESPLLKCDKKPNPILEEMLDKAISTRSIPLHDTEYTMNIIQKHVENRNKPVTDFVKKMFDVKLYRRLGNK